MKSPPLLVCVAGSDEGGRVSATRFGVAGLAGGRGAAGAARAATGGVSAAAPARVAPARKRRRRKDGGRWSSDIGPSLEGSNGAIVCSALGACGEKFPTR